MRLTCPGCGAHGSLELFSSDADARAFAADMGALPPQLAGPLREYLAMFRPAQRALTWPRARRLLADLLPGIQAGRVSRHNREWPAPAEAWKRGMEQMVAKRDQLTLPLKSHGYLFEVVAGVANKAEALAEAEREDKRRVRAPTPTLPRCAGEGEQRVGEVVRRTWIASENAVRARSGQALMRADEEAEFVQRLESSRG